MVPSLLVWFQDGAITEESDLYLSDEAGDNWTEVSRLPACLPFVAVSPLIRVYMTGQLILKHVTVKDIRISSYF